MRMEIMYQNEQISLNKSTTFFPFEIFSNFGEKYYYTSFCPCNRSKESTHDGSIIYIKNKIFLRNLYPIIVSHFVQYFTAEGVNQLSRSSVLRQN